VRAATSPLKQRVVPGVGYGEVRYSGEQLVECAAHRHSTGVDSLFSAHSLRRAPISSSSRRSTPTRPWCDRSLTASTFPSSCRPPRMAGR
jgi:hypothetical protein